MRVAILMASLLGLLGCAAKAPKFSAIAEEFVFNTLTFAPATATEVGYHIHNGIPMDELLDEYSQPAFERQLNYYGRFRLGIRKDVDAAKLAPEDQVDFALVERAIERAIYEIREGEAYKHDPRLYSAAVWKGLSVPYAVDYKGANVRMYQLLKRIERIPARVEQAKTNLVGARKDWNDAARAQTAENLRLLEQIAKERPADMSKRFDVALPAAMAALRSFDDLLRTGLKEEPADVAKEKKRFELAYGGWVKQAELEEAAATDEENWELERQALKKTEGPGPGVEDVLGMLAGRKPGLQVTESAAGLGKLFLAPVMEPELGSVYWKGGDGVLDGVVWAAMARQRLNQMEPRARRILRLLYGSEAMRLGWAMYGVERMMEGGLAKGNDAVRGAWLRRKLEMVRARGPEYVGYKEWMKLRAEAEKKGMKVEEWEEAVMKAGPLPGDLLRKVVGL